jgi:MFS family permease
LGGMGLSSAEHRPDVDPPPTSNALNTIGKANDMATSVFYGWKIVSVCFLIAMFGFGFGFYGTGIYLVSLQSRHGWSTSLISSAITLYYLFGASFVIFIGDAMARWGPRLVVLTGCVAMGIGAMGLTLITEPWQLYPTFLVMAVGWAAMGNAAINTILAPWFEKKRGLTVSLALNGASCGGVCIVPCLMFLIARCGFQHGMSIAVVAMLVVLAPSTIIWLRRAPHELGPLPDGERPLADDQRQTRRHATPNAAPWRRSAALCLPNFWTISIPFALGLVAQVGFLTHQIAYLEPLIGGSGAGFAVSMTTVSAVVGRFITGVYIDRLDQRRVSSVNFLTQALALGAMITSPTPTLLYIASTLFGLGVGNTTSLPGLIVQHEFPNEHFGQIFSLIVAFNQFALAFSPAGMGVLRDVTGSYQASFAVCMLLQGSAAGMVLCRAHHPR